LIKLYIYTLSYSLGCKSCLYVYSEGNCWIWRLSLEYWF